MPSSDSLAGLMKWLRRDPWRDAFADLLERHLGPACDNVGVEIDELDEIIGHQWAMTLWGCAFEDFLTRDVGEAGNIVEDYLKRRGWNEKVLNKAYMVGLRSSVMSLYEVSDIKPEESFLARDLFRGGEPVRVSERAATRTLQPWDRIAGRIVEVRGKIVLGGGLLHFEHDLSETLLASLRRVHERAKKDVGKFLHDLNLDPAPAHVARAVDVTEALRLAAPLVSTYWLKDVLDHALNPHVPEIHNSDGEVIEFFVLHFRLLPGVPTKRVRQSLDRLPDLRPESGTFWNWLAPKAAPSGRSEPEERPGHRFISTMDDGSLVLGTLELKGQTLMVSVNSEGRAERARTLLSPVLEKFASDPLIERQTLEQAMAARPADSTASRPAGLPPGEERRLIHAHLDAHYRKQLDEPIPALGDISPREAVAGDRQKVVAWLKQLENHAGRHDPADPMADYDTTWLWAELGLSDRRK